MKSLIFKWTATISTLKSSILRKLKGLKEIWFNFKKLLKFYRGYLLKFYKLIGSKLLKRIFLKRIKISLSIKDSSNSASKKLFRHLLYLFLYLDWSERDEKRNIRKVIRLWWKRCGRGEKIDEVTKRNKQISWGIDSD